MEFEVPDAQTGSGQAMRLAAEYRTLSVHVGEESQAPVRGRRRRQLWRTLLNELVPLRTAHEQHATEAQQRAAALASVARELRTLRFHKDTVEETYARFGSSALGLESHMITRLRMDFGPNIWRRPQRMIVANVVRWFFGGFNRFLWVAMVVFWLCWKPIGNPAPQSGNMALAIVIIFVICLQALFNAWQEWITGRAMHSIANMMPQQTVVLRDGVAAHVAPADLVPGDIVCLQGGDRAPADVRLVDVSADLLLDRSAVSGVAGPTIGTVECTSANYLETHNVAMAG
ncbi:hypothetical protein GGI22_007828, partial [Coemansia erecta]